MAITVGGTTITFNDGTTQSTAASASSYIGGRGQVFTASGTFTVPTGVTAVKVTVVGGGGGGGYAGYDIDGARYAGGGAQGGMAIKYLSGLTPGATLAVTVGAAGSAGTSANGGAGGTSSVASGTQTITTISCPGGGGGPAGTPAAFGQSTIHGAVGAAPTGGDFNLKAISWAALYSSFAANTLGWPSPLGGPFAAPGGGATAGQTASVYGGGGGGGAGLGSSSPSNGGAGAAGVVIFEW